MKHKAYSKYKNSGVEWLGEVPAHWDIKKLGYLSTKVGSGKTPRGGAETYQNEGVMLIRSQNVQNEGLRLADVVFIEDAVDEEMAATRVYPGDILLNITGASLGRCAIAGKDIPKANVNQHVCIIRIEKKNEMARFLQRAILSQAVQSQIFSFENGSSREGLNFNQVRSLLVAVPPEFESQTIANFLDKKTIKINHLLEKKRALIEKLKEKRTALISRTVTRGLPPDAARAAGLDPHPRLKPSGVEWFGDVPIHWMTAQLKWTITLQRGHDLPLDDRCDGSIPVVSSSGITDRHSISKARSPGIVTGRYGTIGQFYLIDEDYWPLNTTLYSISLHGNSAPYLKYMLQHLSPLFLLNAVKSAVPGVDRNDIHPLIVAIPGKVEQNLMADFLDHETTKIDQLITTLEAAINRLQEYRTALITAAVTGKIDVRQEVGRCSRTNTDKQGQTASGTDSHAQEGIGTDGRRQADNDADGHGRQDRRGGGHG